MSEEQDSDATLDTNGKDDIYFGPKSRPKIIRVLTVLAYVLSVSMAAILLSVYYIFMWDGQPSLASRRSSNMEPRIGSPNYDYIPENSSAHQSLLNESTLEINDDTMIINDLPNIIKSKYMEQVINEKEHKPEDEDILILVQNGTNDKYETLKHIISENEISTFASYKRHDSFDDKINIDDNTEYKDISVINKTQLESMNSSKRFQRYKGLKTLNKLAKLSNATDDRLKKSRNLNGTSDQTTVSKTKHRIIPGSTVSSEDTTHSSTTEAEDIIDVNTETEDSTSSFQEGNRRNFPFKNFFHKKIFK